MTDNLLQVQIKTNRTGDFRHFLQRLKEQKYLQAMAIPGIIWMFVFCYIPMYGIIIAFKNYDIAGTISQAPCCRISLTNYTGFAVERVKIHGI